MNTNEYHNDRSKILRQKAEELLIQKFDSNQKLSETEMLRLVYELQVHQIELEMQNEELVLAKLQEEQIKEKYTELYDFAPSSYFTLSKDGTILELNFSAARLLGKARSLLLKKKFLSFVSIETRNVFNITFENIFTGNLKESCQVTLETLENPSIYVHIEGIVNQSGDQCLLAVTDITERILTENALKESEAKFKHIVGDMQVGVLLQGPQAEILMHNPKALEYLGISEDQLLGKTPFDAEWNVIHEDGSPFPVNIHPVAMAMATRRSVRNVVMGVFHKARNERVWLLVDAEPQLNVNGTVNLVVCSFIDISKRKQAEKELIAAKEKAEESDRLKTAFLLNMSHEIKTPMNAINGFSQMLNKTDLTDEKRKDFTSVIINSSNQLQSIIENILTISALETKQEKVNLRPVCINQIINNLLATIKTQASEQNISIHTRLKLTDEESAIYTDKTKVTQILTNLLTNALKFTHAGFIEIGNRLVEKDLMPVLEFYVKDTGIGIKPEMQTKIFDRFVQVETGLTRKYGGNGLGLSISKGFVTLLGGELWLESEPEKGSTFYFTIPYKPINNSGKTELTKTNAIVKTVLVVEDEEFNYLYIRELLNDMNLKLIRSKNGKEAVDSCKTNTDIDLILMDIKMPIMDGHTAATLIKEFRPRLTIIAQSAYTPEQYHEKYNSNPFDDYITKPIKATVLKGILNKYIS